MAVDGVTPAPIRSAWVVFSDETNVWWLRGLRRGFRHCFVILFDGQNWLSVDPLLGQIAVMAHPAPDGFFLPDYLKNSGLDIVPARLNFGQLGFFLPLPCTCVEVVKRVIGVRRIWVLTPWQLYKYLRNQNIEHPVEGGKV